MNISIIAGFVATLWLAIGLAIGWYGRDMRDKVHAMYDLWKDRLDTPPGVVKLSKRRVTRGQEANIMSDSESGGVMRPRPQAVISDDPNIAANIMAQNKRLRGR
jgi:hypothetical protein